MIDPVFWKNKKVFVTGHTGFKGSWLSLWLQSLGADVMGYALSPPTTPNLFQVAQVVDGMAEVRGDVTDALRLEKTFNAYRPDIVIHLAAQSLVRMAYQDPLNTYQTNVMGTVHLLDVIRRHHHTKPMAVLIATSDKCYENNETGKPYQETDPLGGLDPYSNSKSCAEFVTATYRRAYFKTPIGLASVRCGNVLGGGDWAKDRLIPDIIQASIQNKPMLVRYPDATRPWQHVLDALSGYLVLAQALYQDPIAFAEAWNFGPNAESVKPVHWIIEALSALGFPTLHPSVDKPNHQPESHTLLLDSTKAKKRLTWKPRWSLEKTLKETTDWYQAYARQENMREICLAQITRYRES